MEKAKLISELYTEKGEILSVLEELKDPSIRIKLSYKKPKHMWDYIGLYDDSTPIYFYSNRNTKKFKEVIIQDMNDRIKEIDEELEKLLNCK